jgi:hypothetical protein
MSHSTAVTNSQEFEVDGYRCFVIPQIGIDILYEPVVPCFRIEAGRWRQQVPLELWYLSARLCGVESKKTVTVASV